MLLRIIYSVVLLSTHDISSNSQTISKIIKVVHDIHPPPPSVFFVDTVVVTVILFGSRLGFLIQIFSGALLIMLVCDFRILHLVMVCPVICLED